MSDIFEIHVWVIVNLNLPNGMIIKRLILTTSAKKELTDFYHNTLGISISEKMEESITFTLGHTKLEFTESGKSTPYHFAINIPSNKARGALKWLKDRVEILNDGENDLIDFKSWNAESIYFYDTDRNIVELIARKNLGIYVEKKFSQKYFLGISEIGMPVDNIEKTFRDLNKIKKIEIFDGSFESFCAIGDENGLFIVIDKKKKKWFPSGDVAFSSPFRIEGDFNFKFRDGSILKL
jgi:hypothetical protein